MTVNSEIRLSFVLRVNADDTVDREILTIMQRLVSKVLRIYAAEMLTYDAIHTVALTESELQAAVISPDSLQ